MPNDLNLPKWLMGLIRCPNSGTELMLASPELLQRLRQRREQGQLTTKLGRTVSSELTQGLVSADGRWFYVITNGIADLVPDETIEISESDSAFQTQRNPESNRGWVSE
jgi:uncharacterized protein YbaR (Trm112 family)